MKYYLAALSSLSLFAIDYSTTVVPVDCLSIIAHFKCTHIHRSFLFCPRTSSYINSTRNYHEHGIASISFVASISIIILHILDGWLHRLPYAVCSRGCRKKSTAPHKYRHLPTFDHIVVCFRIISPTFTSVVVTLVVYIYIYICLYIHICIIIGPINFIMDQTIFITTTFND